MSMDGQHESEDNSLLFSQMDAYPWDSDAEFQIGLKAILSSATSPQQTQPLTLRARCFYFNRKNPSSPVDYEAYRTHVRSKPQEPTIDMSQDSTQTNTQSALQTSENAEIAGIATSSPPPPPPPAGSLDTADPQYPQSFAALVSLIQSGAPIPGIREIPDTVLSDLATKPVANKRRKPWEKEDEKENVTEALEGGTFGDRRDEIIAQEYPDA